MIKQMKSRNIWQIIAIVAIFVNVGLGIMLGKSKSAKNFEYLEMVRIHEAELKYWENKSKLADAVQTYIHSIAPTSDLSAALLIDECEEYSVDVKFALAQGELESHFGVIGLAAKTNSVWNVGAYDNLSFKDITKKYKYNHPNESIKPYLELLTSEYLTARCEEELLKKFETHGGKRFATEPKYEERLSYKYKTIASTTCIDSLQQQVRYWKVRSNR